MDIRFQGLLPDDEPTKPGLFTACAAVVPTLRGYKAAPSAQSLGIDALAAACKGAAAVVKLDNSHRIFAGTQTKLYENQSGATWTDRTRASGGDYGLAADARWRFAQFGDVTLAAAKSELLQSSTSAAFANVSATVPKFGVIETVGQFVIAGNAQDQGGLEDGADAPDRVWWCAKGDYTNWTPDIDAECGTLRLTSSYGKIVGLKRFGDRIIVYKANAMYEGVYQGGAQAWDFRELPGAVGAASHEAIANVGTPDNPRHVFMGFDDFYSFDGSRPSPIGVNRIKVSVFSELNKKRADQCLALHDRINSIIYFYYPVSDTVNPEKCVVYNYRTNTWGRDDRTVEAVMDFITTGTAYDDLGGLYSTYADFPLFSYDNSFLHDSFPEPAVFNTSHLLQTLDGTPGTSSFTTGDYGDDVNNVYFSRAKLRFFTAPSAGTMINYYRQNIGDTLTTDATTSMSNARFDLRREARWHRMNFEFTGAWEAPGMVLDMEPMGGE